MPFTLTFGPYTDAIGTVLEGIKGRLVPSTRVLNLDTGAVILEAPVDFTLEFDADGTAKVEGLPFSDEPGLSPQGFTYRVSWPGVDRKVTPESKTFVVPVESGATVDYDKLQHSDVSPGIMVPIAASLQQVEDATAAASAAEASAVEAATSASAALDFADGAADAAHAAQVYSEASAASATAAAQSATASAGSATTAAGSASAAASSAQSAEADAAEARTIAANALVTATVVGDNLILADLDGDTVNAGNVRGPQGLPGDLTPAVRGNPNASFTITAANLPSTRVWPLTQNLSVLISSTNPDGSISGTVTLVIKQAASGGPYTVTWPATLEWAGDAPGPVMPTAPNAELIIHLFWTGSAWRGMVGGVFLP